MRVTDEENWRIKDVWTVKRDENRLERVEEDKRTIKLIFPIELYAHWDGNAYNADDEVRYEISSISATYQHGEYNLGALVEVTQEDVFNLVEYESKKEYFASGIGMVHKQYVDLSIQNFDTTAVQKGLRFVQKLTAHGN